MFPREPRTLSLSSLSLSVSMFWNLNEWPQNDKCMVQCATVCVGVYVCVQHVATFMYKSSFFLLHKNRFYLDSQGGLLGLLVRSRKRTTLMGHQFIPSIYSINVTINLQPKSINVSYPNKTINLTINVDHQCGIDDHQCTARLEGARAQASIYSINVAVSSTGHQCGPSIWH